MSSNGEKRDKAIMSLADIERPASFKPLRERQQDRAGADGKTVRG